MSSEKAVTLSKVINIVRGLNIVLNKFEDTITQLNSKKLIDILLESMSIRFGNIEINSTMSKAAILERV